MRRFTFRFCYSHHASVGHTLKSRARETYVLYNRIMDESDGTSSYTIDMPNGGRCVMIGNVLQQGPQSPNSAIVSIGAEGYNNPDKVFYAAHNTVVNEKPSSNAIFFKLSAGADTVLLWNNLYAGPGNFLNYPGTADTLHNIKVMISDLADPANYDYQLLPGSPAIDAAGMLPAWLTPVFQYAHPLGGTPRVVSGAAIDVGAFELLQASGVSEPAVVTLRVWPNPSAGVFYLSEPIAWAVYDAMGRLVLSGDGVRVDLSSAANGVYYLLGAGRRVVLVR
ncbi:MAG: T9SS type A sorting domain-containing protein [Lewinellaceae bacterium]|nr:T9SS type A sorting domain-containing protein [Lewinellaceae bacterium]